MPAYHIIHPRWVKSHNRHITKLLCLTLLTYAGACDNTQTKPRSPMAEALRPDTTAQVSGLLAPVDIVTDRWGVPHVYAGSETDAAMAMGYLHAKDRLYWMDIMRHIGTGRMAEYFGAPLVEADVLMRTMMMSKQGVLVPELLAQQMSPQATERLNAYARGVNLYLQELVAGQHTLPPGYSIPALASLTAAEIESWSPSDSMAVLRVQEFGLTDGAASVEMTLAKLAGALPPAQFVDLTRFAPADPTVVMPDWFPATLSAPVQQCAVPLEPSTFKLDFAHTPFELLSRFGLDLKSRPARGSNNWVIGGQYTKNGSPIVANDPHLEFTTPATLYNIHLNSKASSNPADDAGTNVMGASVAGIPSVILGHNEDVAWGGTVAGWDVTDAYIERTNEAGTATLIDGRWEPILRFTQKIQIGRGTQAAVHEHVVSYVPHHGPIVQANLEENTALTFKWTGRMPHQELDAMWAMARAKNTGEFLSAVKGLKIFAQNWNAADRYGTLGYFPHALIPVRKSVQGNCRPYLPMDGTGPCEWVGMLAPEQLPSKIQDNSGWLVTANNDIAGNLVDNDPTNDPTYLLNDRALGFRASRITEVLEGWIADNKKVTAADVVALQGDITSRLAQRVVPHLLASAKARTDLVQELGLEDAIARLSQWDFKMASGVQGGSNAQNQESSIAASIYAMYLSSLSKLVFEDELSAASVELSFAHQTKALLLLLEQPERLVSEHNYWDLPYTTAKVESPTQIQLMALAQAIETLGSPEFFSNPDPLSWRWGEIHRLNIVDPAAALTQQVSRSLGLFPRPGGPDTIDVAAHRPGETKFDFRDGAQMRFVAQMLPEGPVAVNALPGGQSDDPQSPHFDDLLKLWLRNETFPYYFKDKDVIENKEHYLRWEPVDSVIKR